MKPALRFDPAIGGHAPGDMRDGLLAAIDAFVTWTSGPEPELRFGADLVLVRISRICQHLSRCSDALPGVAAAMVAEAAGVPPPETYGAAANALEPLIGMRAIRLRNRPPADADA